MFLDPAPNSGPENKPANWSRGRNPSPLLSGGSMKYPQWSHPFWYKSLFLCVPGAPSFTPPPNIRPCPHLYRQPRRRLGGARPAAPMGTHHRRGSPASWVGCGSAGTAQGAVRRGGGSLAPPTDNVQSMMLTQAIQVVTNRPGSGSSPLQVGWGVCACTGVAWASPHIFKTYF